MSAVDDSAPPPQQQADNDDESDICVICMDAINTHACVPCGHQCVCEVCAEVIVPGTPEGICPICRAACVQMMRVYKQ